MLSLFSEDSSDIIGILGVILDYEPGDKVTNPNNKDWGIGQVQSIINDKVTVNFENAGKKVINAKNVELKRIK